MVCFHLLTAFDMKNELSRFETWMRKCSACGACVDSCPSYLQKNGFSPRGRLILVRGMAEGEMEPGEAASAIATCLQCGRCDRVCPSHIPLNAIFFAARRVLKKYLPVSASRRMLARVQLSKPKTIDFIQPLASIVHRAIGRGNGTRCKLPWQPFFAPSTDIMGGKRVLLYPGCLSRRFFPDLARACFDALQKHGFRATIITELPCCGRPQAMQGGNIAWSVKQSIAIMEEQKCELIASPCPGCVRTMKEIWPGLPDLSPEERKVAKRLAERIVEISSLLAATMQDSFGLASGQIAELYWHKPCLLESSTQVERLIGARSNLRIQGPAGGKPACCGESLNCLGVSGSSKKTEDRLSASSRELAINIVREAHSRGIRDIVTACPGCMLALKNAPGAHNISVRHCVEVYLYGRA